MSDYRFGCDDYSLNIYPKEAFLPDGGFDIDKVERVEIEWVDFIREKPPTDAVREFAERYERRIAELEAEVERLRRAGYEHGWHDAMAAKEAER